MNDGRKVILGQLIDFYREELEEKYGPDVWGVDQFIYNNSRVNSESICSRATYYKMKSGELIKKQTYYDLIRKLGYEYKSYDVVDQYIPEIMKELYQAVFYLDKEWLLRLQVRINRLFDEAKEYFYYRDIYKVLSFIIELHCDDLHSFNEADVTHIEKVSKVLNCIDTNILCYSYLVYEVNYTMNISKLTALYSKLPEYEECEDPLVLFCIVYKHNNNLEVELARQTITKLKRMIPEDNFNFLMRVRLRELYYIYYFYSSTADVEYQETYKYILEHPRVSSRVQKNFHYNYAMYLLSKGRREDAIVVFDRFFAIDDMFDIYAETISAICHVLSNKKIMRMYNLNKLDYSNIYSCILEYCIMKQNNSGIGVLLSIVEKKVIPKCAVKLPDDIIDFLRKEINWLAKKSKKYKMVTEFEMQLMKS